MGLGLFLWPDQEALLGHSIDQVQQFQMSFGQDRASALVAAVFGGLLTEASPLVFGNGVKPILSLFTAGQDIGGMQLSASTTAVGFAAFAAEQVKGALDHWVGALESAQGVGEGGIGSPHLLAQIGQFVSQSDSLI